MSCAFLFPGQGSQRPGMLGDLPNSPAVSAVLDEARFCLADLGATGAVDDAEALRDTTNVQLCLTIAGVACARLLTDDRGVTPEFVAGHSVGGFAAAVVAGVLSLPEALTAVHLRAELMKTACAQGEWGMAALSGMPTAAVRELVASIPSELWVANINSATQTVLSGSSEALLAARQAASAADFEMLDVTVASHCPLQTSTATQLKVHLDAVPRRAPRARFLTGVGGRAVHTAELILEDLADGVALPVQWYQASRVMPELGVTAMVEMLPGHVLTHLVAANAPEALALSVQDDGVDAVVRRARRSAD